MRPVVGALFLYLLGGAVFGVLASPGEIDRAATPQSTPKGIPIERRADLFTNSPNAMKMLDLLVGDVRNFGYRCDTISGLISSATDKSDGFRLSCNERRYNYDIRDLGGHIRVQVQE